MASTACRFGSAPIGLDWSRLERFPTSNSPTARAYQPSPSQLGDAWTRARAKMSGEVSAFYDAPIDDSLSQYNATKALADKVRASMTVKSVLFLGIGGSSLGPKSLLQAVKPIKEGPKFHFVDNLDPMEWTDTINSMSPETTVLVICTKSGGTYETVAQSLLALNWLGKSRWKSQVIAITDPAKGELLSFAKQEEIPILTIAPKIGGRFSVFSPVGLLALELAGLPSSQFLEGAKLVRDYCEKTAPEKNGISILAGYLEAHSRSRGTHVFMPYASKLEQIGKWWVQLWGESLGKNGKGFTPIAALGAVDQHSLLQLLAEGPEDKIVWFLKVQEWADNVTLPAITLGEGVNWNNFKLLQGKSMAQLLEASLQATATALLKNNRPSIQFSIEKVDTLNIGALMFAQSVLTGMTAELMEVDAYNQPGVEETKVLIRESLSARD
jgi:glucose-6-phosphate isomerase